MRTFKQSLLTGAAGLALAAGFAISSANAFDRTYWGFYLKIDPCVDIDIHLDPDSMTAVEVEQKSVGNIAAMSRVVDITVLQPGGHHHHNHNNNGNGKGLDAVAQLGSVVSAATAVANNVNVDSVTEAVYADVSQLAKGTYGTIGTVNAESKVRDILNLTVDSAATAVSNNVNVSVDVGQHIYDTNVVANVEQASYMDVNAASIVRDVTLKNYKNLGMTQSVAFRPVVNSVATAVGNNVNVSVFRPTTP